MAELDIQEKLISKKNEGFPEWLDFDRMRQEGIDYLGELSGNIWTDHNAHDPGITILEVLCYALLDLSYRTALPAKDLFAKDPDDTTPENNFFTPAVILGCNPLTITDYRKLLIDVPGVKNAWLIAAEDITLQSICPGERFNNRDDSNYNRQRNCSEFLNGLYHVYIDLETSVRRKGETASPGSLKEEDVIDNVRKALLAHRNLCEDFFDITVLCKQKLGICADVTLHPAADPEKVFLSLMEKLQAFLSPSPRFYRLKQLYEKGKSIEEIFEGRPFDLERSHGFVDVEEFEKIKLRKEIHISDLYNAVGSVEGIISVKNIRIRNSDGSICPGTTDWIFKLYENHVPIFDPLASGLNFLSSRGTITMDTRALSKYFKVNPDTSSKALMTQPNANLDMLLEPGNFRRDLAAYYPIENDFPKVYGITEGSLSDDVSAKRKAQSSQLRAYLLFFDTLLSGYLGQLKNIRSLFAINQPDKELQHTYYVNKLSDRPGLAQLVPYALSDNTPYPTTQAFPVCRKEFEEVLTTGTIDRCNGEQKFPPHQFCSMAERDVAIQQLMEDLKHGTFSEEVFTNKSGCWSFYFFTTSEKFVIVATDFYQHERDARAAAQAMMYYCTSEKSFKRYSTLDKNGFSFNIVSSITGYWEYLSTLAESETLYLQRRNAFLDHLLARFAETFTDYALLSYSFLNTNALQHNIIRNKEKFLSAYPELSSTRGKAYDYRVNGWNNNNVSGVEKRFEAYAGIGLGQQDNLCHFEVAQFEEQTVIQIPWKDKSFITSSATFESREAGIEALSDFLKASGDVVNYEVSESRMEKLYEIHIKSGTSAFQHAVKYETEEKANQVKAQLQRMFSLKPSPLDILPSRFEHTLILEGKENQWTKKDPVINIELTFIPSPDTLADFPDINQWAPLTALDKHPEIKFASHPDWPQELLDLGAFDPYVNRSDVKKKVTFYKYTVSDRDRNFFFMSEQEFEGEPLAQENILRLLFLLIDANNYRIAEKGENEFVMNVVVGNQIIATNTIEFQSEAEAKEAIAPIVEYIQRHSYRLKAESRPDRWRFDLKIGQPGSPDLSFVSNAEYTDVDHALSDAAKITGPTANMVVSLNAANELELKDKKHKKNALALGAVPETMGPVEAKELANDFLSFKRSLVNMTDDPQGSEAQRMVVPDKVSRQGNFGYRLVRKDFYNAWYKIDGQNDDRTNREKKISEVFKLYTGNHSYLQLLYGNNLMVRTDQETGRLFYHFRIVDVTTGVAMFESIQGYASEDLALAAFEARHVSILTAAREDANFNSLISFDETVVHTADHCDAPIAEVFIPAETMKAFGYNTDHARQQLSGLAATFPIQSIKKSDPRFAQYFLCGQQPEPDPSDDCCCTTKEREYYFFVYNHKQDNAEGWISDHYFETPVEALRQFTFFLMLLRYRGNYTIHRGECDCRWRLAIREILAESKNRFINAEAAWGMEGVEKFICASQSKDAFPLIRREADCCFSFYVACGERGLIHPCTYDTPEKRDKALQRLFYASRRIVENWKNKTTDDWTEVLQTWSHPTMDKMKRGSRCQTLVEWIERFLKGEFEKDFELTDPAAATLQEKTISPSYEQMKKVARYFPVRRRKLETAIEQFHYYLHVNLPDFDEPDQEPDPCGCDKSDPLCCTPWISECCFNTCEEALRYYYDILECLADKDHYYPVMDCGCKSYGIGFYCECNDKERGPNDEGMNAWTGQNDQRQEVNCCNEIVAFNPQCYTTPTVACDAIDRAKRLINAEGLHLVEHILLRPHCRESDCKCIIRTCPPDKYPCEFEWKISGDDPCENKKNFCFEPGADPYSFVATVVLPVWPERFQKKENRELAEKMIYREMPAHILPRILWLTPQDLCLFESIYMQWTKWLAHKPVCADYQPACRLIELLFNYPFHCFDCDDCEPCPPGPTVDPCNFMQAVNEVPNRYVNEINKLYCWNEICPPLTQKQTHPDPAMEQPVEQPPMSNVALSETTDDLEEAERGIDLRFHRYREAVDSIRKSSGNTNAEMAAAFLHQSIPDLQSYQTAVEAVMANKRSPENRRLLNSGEKKELIRYVTWYYLDRNILAGRIHENKEELQAIMDKVSGKQLLPDYKDWKGQELTKVKKDARINEVKKHFDRA